jgi:O-antigen ligase
MHEAVAPLYLFACLILGGSAQGIWANMLLQLFGIVLLAWAVLKLAREPIGRRARQLLTLAILALLVIALQLVPLPASLWPHLGGRDALAADYRILGMSVPWLPLSLAPYESLATVMKLIPPLALFCVIVRLRAYKPSWLATSLVAGTVAGVLLGALQVTNHNYAASPWYLYEQSNFGVATGFFANANHMAILLVVTLPFLAALLVWARGLASQHGSAIAVMATVTGLVVFVGIVLNRSLAAYGLVIPVLVASALLLLPQRSGLKKTGLAIATLLLVAAVAFISTRAIHAEDPRHPASTSVETRAAMFQTTARALGDFMPFGSGLGTFQRVYRMYESRNQVTNEYVIHAHDDYLELLLELGVAGMLLMLAFLAWWALAAVEAWRSAESGPFGRAASIASAAILVHSLVDFPLRTAAINAVFATCLALLLERAASTARGGSELWPTRHVVLR